MRVSISCGDVADVHFMIAVVSRIAALFLSKPLCLLDPTSIRMFILSARREILFSFDWKDTEENISSSRMCVSCSISVIAS